MNIRNLVLGCAALAALGSTALPASGETPDQQYQEQLQRYREQQQQYQYQREQYDRHLDSYYYDRTHPYSWWRTAYFHAVPDWYDRYGGELVGVEVDERDGARVGSVSDVERASDGRVDRVHVVLGGNRAVWLDVSHIRYDAPDRIAFVDLGTGELYDRSHAYDYRP